MKWCFEKNPVNYVFSKACNEIIAAVLIIILLSGNLMSCSSRKQEPVKTSSTPDNAIYSEDTTTYAENTATYAEETHTYAEETVVLSEDMISYIEEVTYYVENMVFYEFGEYVDDMYVVVLHTQDYIDEHTVIYDPETGRQINIGSILTKVFIGTAVILICATLSVPTGGAGALSVPAIWAAALPIVHAASVGAATGSAISGAISFIASGGSTEELFYGAIEGAADGFMWGAILSPGALKLAKLQIGKITTGIRNTSQFKSFSQIIYDTTTRLGSTIDDVIRPIAKSDILTKYGDEGQKIVDTIIDYTGLGYDDINTVLRKSINNPTVKEQAARISKFLKDQPLIKNAFLYRGEPVPLRELAQRYLGIDDFGGTLDDFLGMIKKSSKLYTDTGFTSTSTTLGTAKYFTNGALEDIRLIRELHIGNAGVHGANIVEISVFPDETEILLDTNLRTKIINAFIDGDGFFHIIEEVL